MRKDNQSGQIVIIGLLIMVVALAIGLSVASRSTTEISTSTKTEDTSRAFSAAESGIEKALGKEFQALLPSFAAGTPVPTIGVANLTNLSLASVETSIIPGSGIALEHPPIGKWEYAQFWLASPDQDSGSPYFVPNIDYNQNVFYLYFGNPGSYSSNMEEQPAAEINVISYNSAPPAHYESKRYYFDSNNTRASSTNFSSCTGSINPPSIETNTLGNTSAFYCKATIQLDYTPSANHYPIMARIRVLYANINIRHKIAIQPTGGDSLPLQAFTYTSKGSAGSVQRMIRVFQEKNVLPFPFDFALFSGGSLQK